MPEQSTFAEIFDRAAFEERAGKLPSSIEEALCYFQGLILRYDDALRKADLALAQGLNDEAHDLARKLNSGDPAILAFEHSPGSVLERKTAAAKGQVPRWGQTGQFPIETASGLKVLILMEGIFGLAVSPVPSFSAFAINPGSPFLSPTGYKSFLGRMHNFMPGMTPDAYAKSAIEDYIETLLHGKLQAIQQRYRETILNPDYP